jgi:hypothetical protein
VAGVGVASIGFVLHSPVGILAAVLLAVGAAFAPVPLAVAFGHVALGAFFGSAFGPTAAIAETGLLLLLLDSLPSIRTRTGRTSVAAAAVVTIGLTGLYVGSVANGTEVWLAASAAVGLGALLLYGGHRYQKVTLGMVER